MRRRSRDAPFLLAPEPGARGRLRGRCARTARALRRALCDASGIAPGERRSAFMLPNGVARRDASSSARCTAATSCRRSTCSRRMRSSSTRSRIRSTRIVFAARRIRDRLDGARRAHRRDVARSVDVDLDGLELPRRSRSPRGCRARSRRPGDADVHVRHDRQPKGALLSHANMLHAGRAVARSLALTPADRVLSSLPLYHINGQCIATVAPLVSGGSIVMPHRFSVSQWWPLVERYRPTWLNVVPTIIAYLLNGPRRRPRRRRRAAACASRARRRRRCRRSSIARSRSASASR